MCVTGKPLPKLSVIARSVGFAFPISLTLGLLAHVSVFAQAAMPLAPIDTRFASAKSSTGNTPTDVLAEVPDFRRHVVPLLGRLGCNGRACHGSFQGQGGFRLSLFGYDFKADHENLLAGESPRVQLSDPDASLFLQKPLEVVDHEGGQRLQNGSWQLAVLRRWIEDGGKGVTDESAKFVRLEVSPAEIVASQKSETWQLRAIAVWSDGSREDVTPLCRFRSNDDQIAIINETGLVTAQGPGDSHVVAFYDNGVVPVPVVFPVSDKTGPNYPDITPRTTIDELVLLKLKKLGEVPSGVCDDGEFLRRVSLDITGTLPTVAETESFLADGTPEKRARKIDELLERNGYSAWWATKFCDWTGNNARKQQNNSPENRNGAAEFWYEWMQARISENLSYDKLVERIVLAKSRLDGESYEDYCARMSSYLVKDGESSFADQPYLPYFWTRNNFRTPEERALGFAYTFLGVRIQCAQCHKHPFDQWTKDDFDRFENFFTRVRTYQAKQVPDGGKQVKAMLASLDIDPKDKNLQGNRLNRELALHAAQGKVVPFAETAVLPPPSAAISKEKLAAFKAKATSPAKAKKLEQFLKGRTATVLGGEEIRLDEVEDPREILMQWMLDESNPYFAQSIVNRVWAAYFNVGIVEPPDDLSLANPPSNPALLEHLATEFRQHGYDLKWLHREICNSDTYQRSWRPNATNAHDERNFSRAVARRIPAEVVYDAIKVATAGDREATELCSVVENRAIADAIIDGTRGGSYALQVFGQSIRESNCDCDRSMEPSLLQTVFLQNDEEMLAMISRRNGWVDELSGKLPEFQTKANEEAASRQAAEVKERLDRLQGQLDVAVQENNKPQMKLLRKMIAQTEERLPRSGKTEVFSGSIADWVEQHAEQADKIIESAYLRTLVRRPSATELERAVAYLKQSTTAEDGIRDLLWALLNTKEFVLNH